MGLAARLWATWSARNDALWNNKIWTADYLIGFVENCVNSWKQCYVHTTNASRENNTVELATWFPPLPGMLKCNVDAALLHGNLGFGAVIRDHAG
nr:uncharacterized protein LOC109158014 [Ipomoea trifida]